jgi:hypothetical protein
VFVPHVICRHTSRHEVSRYDRSVVVFIGKNVIAFLDESGDYSLRRLVPRAEDQTIFTLKEFGKFFFEFDMDLQSPVKIPRSGTAAPELFYGLDCRFLHLGVSCQSEIIIRTAHDHAAALHDYDRTVVLLDRAEIRVETRCLYFIGTGKIMTFLKEVQCYSPYGTIDRTGTRYSTLAAGVRLYSSLPMIDGCVYFGRNGGFLPRLSKDDSY